MPTKRKTGTKNKKATTLQQSKNSANVRKTNATLSPGKKDATDRAFRRLDPSKRGKRPRPRESDEPESIALLNIPSSSSEDELSPAGNSSKRLRLSEFGQPVLVRNEQPDNALLRDQKILCEPDQDLEAYTQLVGSSKKKMAVPVIGPEVKFTSPQKLIWTDPHLGVHVSTVFKNRNMESGYLRIEPLTVKPFETSESCTTCLAVIEGKIRCKSSQLRFDSGTVLPHLDPVELIEGSNIRIKPGTVYSLENWTDEEAALHFVLLRE